MAEIPPQPTERPIDPVTGEWTASWKRWFAELERIIRGL